MSILPMDLKRYAPTVKQGAQGPTVTPMNTTVGKLSPQAPAVTVNKTSIRPPTTAVTMEAVRATGGGLSAYAPKPGQAALGKESAAAPARGPAASSGGSGVAAPAPNPNSLDAKLRSVAMSGLDEGPFNKTVMQQMDDDLFSAMQGRIAQGQRQANTGAAARGLLRSGIPGTAASEITRGAEADYTSGLRKNRTEATNQNAAAKQNWWGALSDINQTDIQRAEQAAANRAAQAAGAQRMAAEKEAGMINLTNPDGSVSKVPRDILNMLMEGEG